MRPIRAILDTLGGVYQLLRLALLTGFAFKGPYWQWRLNTAFGRGYPAGRAEMFRSVLDYGRWIHRMRRGV